jgi:membrane fusion protein (multidrug efflux system)
VVQRLPVRLVLENPPSEVPLHAGLSATVEIDTHYRRPWMVWAENTAAKLFGTARASEPQR